MLRTAVTREAAGTRVIIDGEISETSDLRGLGELSGFVTLDLRDVRRINSYGTRELQRFLAGLKRRGATVQAESCSPAIVNLLGMVPEIAALMEVRSLVLPLECDACETSAQEDVRLIVGERAIPATPHHPCPRCGAPMMLAELPERYFAFLHD